MADRCTGRLVACAKWEHWPTAARARAFGIALALPEDGVRDLLVGVRTLQAEDVLRIMNHYGTGVRATTYRMQNLGLIGDEERFELAHALLLQAA